MTRGLQVLLCALLLVVTSTPAWAIARPENRVWKIFSEPSKTAAADLDQTLEPRGESAACGYDFASGVHKYLYTQDNPVMGIDPSGHGLISLSVSIAIRASLGALSGVAINGVYNYAVGNPYFQGAGRAAYFGAGALPLALASPIVGAALAGVGVYSSSETAYHVFTSSSSASQKGTAVFLVGLSLFGGYAVANNAAEGSLWVNTDFISAEGAGPESMTAFQRGVASSKDYTTALKDALAGTPLKGRITMAVGVAEDSSGNRVVLIGTSEPNGYIRPAVRTIIAQRGGTVVSGTGHAEADIVAYARNQNLTLISIGATRPICTSCGEEIAGAGATAATPLKNP